GILELTPGIRSLQVHFEPSVLPRRDLLDMLKRAELTLDKQDDLEVPSRIVHLPLSWDDEACRLAIEKYMQSVRKDAPWCPSNIEFIRRINGLDSIDEVKKILFDASYVVMGLGDVYLGAPVATPYDPRHRLVTTKYNPARTWTAENSVGIGGSYLCVYGMEGPGGYQFVGRTMQMWNRFHRTEAFTQPWLLRFFDQVRYYPVSEAELAGLRDAFREGRLEVEITEETFNLAEHRRFLESIEPEMEAFREHQQAAYREEVTRWQNEDEQIESALMGSKADIGEVDGHLVSAEISGNVWKLLVEEGASVEAGQTLVIVEAMKMEFEITAGVAGTVTGLHCKPGTVINAGDPVVVIDTESAA
ncbi:MAG TPA: urea carboxylase, partial [Alcanivorax sp.]|nr:urea carboxylase [Alcanivorax sp.]